MFTIRSLPGPGSKPRELYDSAKNGDYQTEAELAKRRQQSAKLKEKTEQKAAAAAAAAGSSGAVASKKNKASSGAKGEYVAKTSPVTKLSAAKVPAINVPSATKENKRSPAKVAGKGPKKLVSLGVKKALKIPVPIEPPKQQQQQPRVRGKAIAAAADAAAAELVPGVEGDSAMVGKKKGGKAKLPSAPVRSLLQRLQETTEAARHARELLCSCAPSLRAVMLGVVNLGFYFSTHRRRTKFATQWSRDYIKGEKFTKGEKLTASIKVWVVYLGLTADAQKALVDRVMAFLMSGWQEEDERITAAKAVIAAAAAEARALTSSTKTKGKGKKGGNKSMVGKGKKRIR